MKKTVLSVAACLLAISRVTSGAIVYSGSQFVSLSPMSSMQINIASSSAAWDDFQVELVQDGGMMMMGVRITAPGFMTMGGMGGIFVMSMMSTMGMWLGLDLDSGATVGPLSGGSETYAPQALLTDSGGFGEDGGYIGLMMRIPDSAIAGAAIDELHYAWLHLSSLSANGGTFDSWAYEDLPDVPIGAGSVPVPAAVVIGAIGLGFAGWRLRRRTA